MPVVVTGADTRLGRHVIARLTGRGLDLRATVSDRDAVRPLVERGVKTAVSDLVDTERLGAVMEDAHTVIHLHGVDVGAGAVLDAVPDILAAAEDSGVARIVTCTGFGLDDHPGLIALLSSGYDVVALRVGTLLVPLSAEGASPPSLQPRLRVAPIWLDDFVDALVAADRLRDLHGVHVVDAVGPDVVTGAELDRLLGASTPLLRRLRPRSGEGQEFVGDGGRGLRELLGVTVRPLAESAALAMVDPRD
jgi:uncharacterized protein YbjT (DUF2867 family)